MNRTTMNRFYVCLSCMALLLVNSAAMARTTIIYAGELLAIPGEASRTEQTIIIEDDKIIEVRPGYIDAQQLGKQANVIDLKDSFVLPGLMDMHVHLQLQYGPQYDKDSLKMSDQLWAMRSIHYGMKTLLAGFTTVRDVGSDTQYMYALRDAIENGWVDGPRIIAAGSVGITGGHGDISGVKPVLMEMFTEKTICDGPYDCRRATRHAIKFGADLIKIASTGGVTSDLATGTGQQMEMDELKEIVRAAKSMGKKVTSHAHQEEGIIAALEAGVDSIEHGTYAGKKSIKWFHKTGAYLVPTLLAGQTIMKIAQTTDLLSPAVTQKAMRVGRDMKENFSKVYESGVKIAFGTDSGVSHHGDNAQEAVLMYEAGMAPMQIIKSATVNTADLLDMSDKIGTIEPNKQADIIATRISPLKDIKQLLDVTFVMKSGKTYRQ
jgi:imidazolonepropionase-like amidohydrolase